MSLTEDLGLSDRWTKPIGGSSDRDLRAERAASLLHQADSMERAAAQLPFGAAREEHVQYACRVRAQGQLIAALVSEWDDVPYQRQWWERPS